MNLFGFLGNKKLYFNETPAEREAREKRIEERRKARRKNEPVKEEPQIELDDIEIEDIDLEDVVVTKDDEYYPRHATPVPRILDDCEF